MKAVIDWAAVRWHREPPPSGADSCARIEIMADATLAQEEIALESGGTRTVFRTVRSLRDVIRPADRDAAWFRTVRACLAPAWERASAAGLSDVSTYLVLLSHLGTREPDAFRACPAWARDLLATAQRSLRARR